MQEKALSLPIGKVSFRQLGVILSGILGAMVSYFVTKDFVIPGVVLAVFLGLGLVNTKIMSPDQVIKANLLFLIRGTSLSKNRPQKVKSVKDKSKKSDVKKNNNYELKIKQSISSQIVSVIQSLFVKHDKTKPKKHTVKIELTRDNQLKIIPKNNTDLTLLQDKVNIVLDDVKTDDFMVTKSFITIPLDKNSNHSIFAIIDDNDDDSIEEKLF